MNDKEKSKRSINPAWILSGPFIIATSTAYNFGRDNPSEDVMKNVEIRYVNKDSLPDIMLPNGKIYLQRKDGKFQSIDEVLKQNQAKNDSTYKAKVDSLKNVYKNK